MSIKEKLEMSLDEVIEKENPKNFGKVTEKRTGNKYIDKNQGHKVLHSIIISNVRSKNIDLYRSEFSKFGKIYNLFHDYEKHVTYVKYDNKISCDNAINAMNHARLDGDTITVTLGKRIFDKKNGKPAITQNRIIQPLRPIINYAYPTPCINNFPPNLPPAYNYQNNCFDKTIAVPNFINKSLPDAQKSNTVIVTNVPTYLNSDDIFAAFKETGQIMDVQILMNEKRELVGIVIIEYEKNEYASEAVRKYDGGFINDNRIRVFLDCR